MRGLKLPTMHPVNLRDILRPGQTKTVAYETTVTREGDSYNVAHHGHPIARISAFGVTISNAGYWSSTTRDRLTTILHDNGIHGHVFQRAGEQYLRVLADHNDPSWSWEGAREYPFSRAHFDMVAGEWQLSAISDSQHGDLYAPPTTLGVAA